MTFQLRAGGRFAAPRPAASSMCGLGHRARLLAELRAEYSIDASVYERVYDRDRGMRACVWYMVLWKRALSGKRCERRSPYLNVKAPDARQFRRYPTLSFPAPVEQRCGALPVRLRVRYDSR